MGLCTRPPFRPSGRAAARGSGACSAGRRRAVVLFRPTVPPSSAAAPRVSSIWFTFRGSGCANQLSGSLIATGRRHSSSCSTALATPQGRREAVTPCAHSFRNGSPAAAH